MKKQANEKGEIKCASCKNFKPPDEFLDRKDISRNGKRSWCKTCERINGKQWAKDNPEKVMSKGLKRRYNITLQYYNELFEKQKGVCKICGKPEIAIDKVSKNVKNLSVDHNHVNGAIRGLLCGKCNVALGLLNDNISLLESAMQYLKENENG